MDIEEFKKLLENSDNRIQLIADLEIVEDKKFNKNNFFVVLEEILTDEEKQNLLFNISLMDDLLKKLNVDLYGVSNLVASINNDEMKKNMLYLYDFCSTELYIIIRSFSDENKIDILLEEGERCNEYIEDILSTLSVDSLVKFFSENLEYLIDYKIKPYMLTSKLLEKEQIEIVSKLEETGLPLNEKLLIIATLSLDVKQKIDTSSFMPEYITALNISVDDNCIANIDWDSNLEQYHGLDDLILIDLDEILKVDKEKIKKLVAICPNVKIMDDARKKYTYEQYESVTEWIETIIEKIDQDWTDIQKLAFIYNEIGKRLSFCPDDKTEVENVDNQRAIHKIIESGYTVCEGFARVGKLIINTLHEHPLAKVGFTAKHIGGHGHAFLLIENIELPTETGTNVKGNTIIDSTWDLAAIKYGMMPSWFCVNYKQARNYDKNRDGIDCEAHKNDKELSSANIGLDKKILRKVFKSIGLTNEQGHFPIIKLINRIDDINNKNLPVEQRLQEYFNLIAKYDSEFAKSMHETTALLKNLIENEYMQIDFNKCVIKRVYEKSDNTKQPVMYVYIELQNGEKLFYYVDKDLKKFAKLSQNEFKKRFECYESDMRKGKYPRPWEGESKVTIREIDIL